MDSDTVNCTPNPIFKELTQFFLDNFGTNALPAEYVIGDTYGPKTNKQDFGELFLVFDILIVLAVLCIFVLLMMILLLIWYCKRCNCESEPCRRIKLWTMLITSLLLISLILSAFGLYIVFKNIAYLKKIYTKPEDPKGNEFNTIGGVVSKTLGNDFEQLKDDSISNCMNSDLLKDLYPATTKMRKISKANMTMYKRYIENYIMPAFPNTLLYDDVYRMFTRNFTAFVAKGKKGLSILNETNAVQYSNNLFSLEDKKMTERNAPYKFGYIICIIAIAVLVLFLILLLCSLCLKFKTMIKPLIFIFIILTLAFILMAFVTFFHFFYGVIDYNGLCKDSTRIKADSFIYSMHKQCTDNQNVYNLLTDNHWIISLSEWDTIDETEIIDDCKDTCTILDRECIKKVLEYEKNYPKKNFCEYDALNQSWLDLIIDKSIANNKNRTLCLLDMAKKGTEVSKLPPEDYTRCTTGYKAGKQFSKSLQAAYDESNSLCETTVRSCEAYGREISHIVEDVIAFKTNSENKLKQVLGPCDVMLSSARTKQNEFCNCESYILNGVWVGSILFLLGTLLALLLLPCLLCLFVKCSEDDCMISRRDGESDDSDELAHSIVLPAITLPKHVINSLQENPRVNYKVKKIN